MAEDLKNSVCFCIRVLDLGKYWIMKCAAKSAINVLLLNQQEIMQTLIYGMKCTEVNASLIILERLMPWKPMGQLKYS